jgi:hypothetical protein
MVQNLNNYLNYHQNLKNHFSEPEYLFPLTNFQNLNYFSEPEFLLSDYFQNLHGSDPAIFSEPELFFRA